VKDPGSWNKYSYTRNDPVNRIDPNGTCDETTYDVKNGVLQIIGINPCTPIFIAGFSINYTAQSQLQQDYESGACNLASGRPCYDADRLRRNLGMLSAEACTAAEYVDLTCGNGVAIAGMLSRFGRFAGGLGVAGWWQMAKFLGDQGEKIVGDALRMTKNTLPLKGTNLIPNFVTDSTIYEVKNVSSLSFTEQLRNYSDWAITNNFSFVIYVREGAQISSTLRAAAQSGLLEIRSFVAPIFP